MKKYLTVHERGLETAAIWQQYLPSLAVGTIALAGHAGDVNLLDTHILDKLSAANQWRLAQLGRSKAAADLDTICARVCGLVESTLPDDDEMRKLIRGVHAVKSRSFEAVTKRSAECLDLWQKFNAHRAAMSPAQPALSVDDVTVTGFQSLRGNYAQLLAGVKENDIAHDRKLSQLQSTVAQVDRQNKRWFKAWRSHFAAGTPERNALRRVSTQRGQTLPGQGVILTAVTLPNHPVKLSFGAARATSFTLSHKGPGEGAFSVLADGLTAKTFEHSAAATGAHTYKVIGHNSAGDGTESAPFVVTLAQQAAA